MKFFRSLFKRTPAVAKTAFTKTSKDYITADDVRRANDRLMGKCSCEDDASHVDVYERYGLTRPTREQIAEAGAQAMRDLRLANSKR